MVAMDSEKSTSGFGFINSTSFSNVQIYLHTKFSRGISIHGQVITTSDLWKQMSAILALYFRFRITYWSSQVYGILHRSTKFEVSSCNRFRDVEEVLNF